MGFLNKLQQPAVSLIGSAIGAGVQGYGATRAAQANTQAAQLQAKATADQQAFLREQEATRAKEYADQQAAAKAAWTAEQARRAPYRAAAQNAMVQLAKMAGVAPPNNLVSDVVSDAPPPGWTPQSTVAGGSVPLSSLMPTSGTNQAVAAALSTPRRVAMQQAPLQMPQQGSY